MENDETTRIIGRPVRPVGGEPNTPQGDETRIIGRPTTQSNPDATRVVGGGASQSSDATVIWGPPTRRRSKQSSESNEANPSIDQMHDPVVGWLAVVGGPGAGGFVRLGYGMNSIGRSDDQRCRLNFGDEQISRQNHANISYEPRERRFFLQHGGGQNLTYVNGSLVLQPVELSGGEMITLGGTTLRFVPLCGASFDYPDIQGGAAE